MSYITRLRNPLVVPRGPLRLLRDHPFAQRLVSCRIPADWTRAGFRNLADQGAFPTDLSAESATYNGFVSGALGLGWDATATAGLFRVNGVGSRFLVPYNPQDAGGHQPFTIAIVGQRSAGTPSVVEVPYSFWDADAADSARILFTWGNSAGTVTGDWQGQVKGPGAANSNYARMVVASGSGAPGQGQPFVSVLTTVASNNHGMVLHNLGAGVVTSVSSSTSLASQSSANRNMAEGFGGLAQAGGTMITRANIVIHGAFAWDRFMDFREMHAFAADPFAMIEHDAAFDFVAPDIIPSGEAGDLYVIATG